MANNTTEQGPIHLRLMKLLDVPSLAALLLARHPMSPDRRHGFTNLPTASGLPIIKVSGIEIFNSLLQKILTRLETKRL